MLNLDIIGELQNETSQVDDSNQLRDANRIKENDAMQQPKLVFEDKDNLGERERFQRDGVDGEFYVKEKFTGLKRNLKRMPRPQNQKKENPKMLPLLNYPRRNLLINLKRNTK